MRRLSISLAVMLAAMAATAGHASAARYAPVDKPGPALAVSKAKLASALRCSSSVAAGKRSPVLLIPGTTLTPDVNFSWNYVPALAQRGIPYCTVELPNHAMSDIQDSAEYVVNALRTMRRRSGHKVQVIGYSQGGMIGRWALRFWPDTRPMVDDLVGLDPSNHGTLDTVAICAVPCAPSIWQQAADANFMKAVNEPSETFKGIDYTTIYSRTDEVVVPNLNAQGSSSLRTGAGRRTNIAVQELCPTDVSEHIAMGTFDPVGWSLAYDAITHPGVASKGRVGSAPCSEGLMPGVNPATFVQNLTRVGATAGQQLLRYPKVAREPTLKCYVFASCPAGFAQARCLDTRGSAGGKALGPVVLGRSRTTIRRRLGSRRNRRTRLGLDRWCVQGGGLLTAGYPTTHLPLRVRHALRRRAVVGLSSSRRFSARGVKAGQSARTARRRLRHERRFRVGKNTWYVVRAAKSTVVVRTRRGKVRAVGIAARSATRSRRAQRAFLGGWHLSL